MAGKLSGNENIKAACLEWLTLHERKDKLTAACLKITLKIPFLLGWSIVIGSWFDIYSDFVINNRSLGNFGPIVKPYNYGFLGFYGIGFGFPLLLGLPDDNLECGADDFAETLQEYR